MYIYIYIYIIHIHILIYIYIYTVKCDDLWPLLVTSRSSSSLSETVGGMGLFNGIMGMMGMVAQNGLNLP